MNFFCFSLLGPKRLIIGFFTVLTMILHSTMAVKCEEELDAATQGFIQSHCSRCHGESKQKGGFRIDNLEPDFHDPVAAEKWSEVAFRIKSAEMPPPEEPQPSAAEIGRVVEFLTQKVREGSAIRMAKRGLYQQYRLSREEYAHTIYDLLGVVFDVDAPGAFNEEPRWQGFDRVGALLSLSPSHIQRYLEAADTVVELAFPDQKITSRTEKKSVGPGKRQLLQLGEGWKFEIKHPGRYLLRVRASGLPAFTGRIPRLSVWHNYHKRSYAGADLVAEENAPATLEFDGLYPSGIYTIRNHARTMKHANGGLSLFRNEVIDADKLIKSLIGGHRSPWTKVVDENGQPTMPLLLVDWVEIEGPIQDGNQEANLNKIFPEKTSSSAERLSCLKQFAERAWRRPVATSEIDQYVELIESEMEAGAPYKSAYRTALASMLISRSFFCLEEGSPDQDREKVNDTELANRLSYLLWSSMPDKQLFSAAKSGKLHMPENLAGEFERMVSDSKIERFLDSFPKQWLQLHRVGMFQPDPNLYPAYGPWLEESMIEETTRYFSEMFRRNLPIREFIESDWTMLNQRLAVHYDLPQPMQTGFALHHFKDPSKRGGILTHGSILSLTSDGTRHRPVHRGAWVLEALFARTPPPPPPNVDPLEPVMGNKPKKTIRAKLEAHAIDPNCISCHKKIDPLGLAFENYDAVGRWRETERVADGAGEDPAVDATGKLANGKVFDGPFQFKEVIADEEEKFAEGFLEHLATYALRRVITIDDKEALKSIVHSELNGGLRLKNLVRAFILSDLFQKR